MALSGTALYTTKFMLTYNIARISSALRRIRETSCAFFKRYSRVGTLFNALYRYIRLLIYKIGRAIHELENWLGPEIKIRVRCADTARRSAGASMRTGSLSATPGCRSADQSLVAHVFELYQNLKVFLNLKQSKKFFYVILIDR